MVDPDEGDGKSGLAEWAAVRTEHDVTATWRARTPGGGEHWYYREHDRHPVGNDASGKVATNVDVRGIGGFVIAPPSNDARGQYRWTEGEPEWTDLPVVPHIVIERMKARPTPTETAKGGTDTRERATGERREFTHTQAVEFCRPNMEALRESRNGEINDRLNVAAKTLSHFGPEFWSREYVEKELYNALSATEYDAETWRAADTIESAYASAEGDWKAILKPDRDSGQGEPFDHVAERERRVLRELENLEVREEAKRRREGISAAQEDGEAGSRVRRVDLSPFLNGTYVPLKPTVGGKRDDHSQMLYPGRWHSLVALTAAGKSWFALWHAVQVLRDGGTVVYAHFEESMPGGTLDRLRSIAPNISVETLAERFIWLDCSAAWGVGEFAASLPENPTLIILDGINAACGQHGWDVNIPATIGTYRGRFVTPGVKRGAAVLSLGHPPKAKDRQDERHGFGSSAWLDEVDGAAFRMEAAKKTPIRRDHKGYSALYSVKDRYGEVERNGLLETGDQHAGWYYQGAFTVDSSPAQVTTNAVAYLTTPERTEEGQKADAIDHLGAAIVGYLQEHGGRFATARELNAGLRAARIVFSDRDLAPALERLTDAGTLEWPDVEGRGKPRPGWISGQGFFSDA